MDKIKSWLAIILALITLALIGWNLSDSDETNSSSDTDNSQPTYQSQETITFVYDPTGKLTYKLVADDVQNYAESKLTWFTKPVLTTYDSNAIATWTVRANKAKLTNDRMLYLYGDVQVDSLTDTTQLQRITTENANRQSGNSGCFIRRSGHTDWRRIEVRRYENAWQSAEQNR